MKKILDSVHGYIKIEDDYCKNIIDNKYFQRLRRIEQTSTRALFPSARHDRFIHSLGVYHLGCKIVDKLQKKYCTPLNFNTENIYRSYKLACLLHDVGHSPFSHTFEDFYDNNKSDLRAVLKNIVNSKDFSDDIENSSDRSSTHERMSAIVALKVFSDFMKGKGADLELIARMIIGLYYTKQTEECSFRNAMIDLIHGDVIDADGLDYVCRDVWASGYSTTKIDVERLIDSIRIEKEGSFYTLCFTSKSINEIESVLKVKTFQQYNVLTHHTVKYEQKLLVEAVKSAAMKFIGYDSELENSSEDKKRENAIKNLCSIYSFVQFGGHPIGVKCKNNVNIALPMDDDFISLIKSLPDDKYVKQWLSRKYILKPLWKSKAEFYSKFKHLRDARLLCKSWIFSNDCRNFICEKFNISPDDVWIERATPKYKMNFAEKVKIFIDNKVVKFSTLFPEDVQSYAPPANEFYYIYIPQDLDKEVVFNALVEESQKYYFYRN